MGSYEAWSWSEERVMMISHAYSLSTKKCFLRSLASLLSCPVLPNFCTTEYMLIVMMSWGGGRKRSPPFLAVSSPCLSAEVCHSLTSYMLESVLFKRS